MKKSPAGLSLVPDGSFATRELSLVPDGSFATRVASLRPIGWLSPGRFVPLPKNLKS
jgi:hypothetical protein